MSQQQYTFTRGPALRRLQQILDLLTQSATGMTRKQIAAAVHIGERNVKPYLAALRGAVDGMPRRIRVGKWRRQLLTGGHYEAVFVIGTASDAKKPRALSPVQRTQRYRKRLQEERPDVHVDQLKKLAARRALQRPARRDVAVAALFGAAP